MRVLLAALGLLVLAPAQEKPELRVLLAPDAEGQGPPALVWLRRSWLPVQSFWPRGLDPSRGLRIHAGANGVRCSPSPHEGGSYLEGEFVLPGLGSVLLSCDREGIEDWYAPQGPLPPRLGELVSALGDLEASPRTVDAGVFCGVLGPGLADGDPLRPLLSIAMSRCGEVVLRAWRSEDGWRVRGRSAGGLLLPALGAFLAACPSGSIPTVPSPGNGTALVARAFAGRDPDRAEAARQMARTRTARVDQALDSLAFGDSPCRLQAIDSLLRRGDPADLERILAAVDPASRADLDIARDAIADLWPGLSPAGRERLRAGLSLRRPEVCALLPARGPVHPGSRYAAAAALAVLLFGTLGFWLRERNRPA
ncbi:MAG: hypothetical protein Fur0037_14280 [Planctomycetota bacterium]